MKVVPKIHLSTRRQNKVSDSLKIAVISDPHLGAKWGTAREHDSFIQFREAVEKSLELGAQLIVLLGDIFDTRVPRQEVWARALRILSTPLARGRNQVNLIEAKDKEPGEISPVALRGTPVISLHGNHERRTRGLTNPVEALEAAGLLIHLHQGALVFETPDGGLAIHGMSNVPEQHARKVLATWNPKPVEGAFNIIALHQSVGKFVYSSEERPTLDLADLPAGFDLYLCGHIHYRNESTANGRPLLFPGGTERTQLLQVEAETPKGFYMVEIGDGLKYDFVELASPRDFFYAEMRFVGVSIPELNKAVRAKVGELLGKPRKNPDKLPLIRVRLVGTLAKEASRGEFDERAVTQEFEDRALVVVSKGDLVAPGLEEKVQLLRELRERRMSVDDTAMVLLEENLREAGYTQIFDVRTLYGLLVEGREEDALRNVFGVVENLVNAGLRRKSDDNQR
ncbi:MAG TPA: DNA repair exonuclease [Hadesarchaea archaeon]|nr:DNA repair exonuclease [Hadesarchaea archaeon]